MSAAIECTAGESWAPNPQSAIHLGFDDDISDRTAVGENTTFETHADCDAPVTDAETCDPSCLSSLDCFGAGENGKAPGQCWRSVVIDVTTDVQNALAASPANLHPSWMIKRRVESGSGSFHFFSREGAICVLGASDPDYEGLQPVLVVTLTGGAPTITAPPDHCEAY